MTPREELAALRRMAELEAKAAGQSIPAQQPAPQVSEIPAPRRNTAEATGSLLPSMQTVGNIGAGLARGLVSIPSTVYGMFQGEGDKSLGQRATEKLTALGAEPESTAFKGGQIAGEVVSTLPVGGALAAPVKAASAIAPRLAPLATALQTGGMGATGAATKLGGAATRVAGGAAVGGTSAALINPEDIGTGAAIGAALPAVGAVAGKGVKAAASGAGSIVDAFTGKTGTIKSAKIARDVAGENINAIRAALRASPQDVNAFQATAGVPNRVWQSLGEISTNTDQNFLLLKQQADDQLNALARISKSANPTEARALQQKSQRILNDVTSGLREDALSAANMATSGIKLDANSIVSALDDKITQPGTRASTTQTRILQALRDDLVKLTNQGGGVIDAHDLYTLRKEGLNERIAQLLGPTDPKVSSKVTSKILAETKPLIDEAIKKAGGTGWDDYLRTYEQGMRQIDKKVMAAKAMELFADSPNEYVKLVRGKNPDAVEAVFGYGNYDIFKEMSKEMPTLQKGAEMIERDAMMKQLASLGKQELNDLLAQRHTPRLRNFLSRTITVFNTAMDELDKKLGPEIAKKLRQAGTSADSMLQLLDTLPASERVKVLRVLSELKVPEKIAKPAAQAARVYPISNAMAPQPESENALAP